MKCRKVKLDKSVSPLCSLVCRCMLVEKFKSEPSNLNDSVQNLPMNRPSRSLIIFLVKPQYFTMFFRNNRVASSTGHSLVAEMNMAYFKKRSTITTMVLNLLELGILTMKSKEMLSHECSRIGRGSRGSSMPYAQTCLVGTQDKFSHMPPHHHASEANNSFPHGQALDTCLDDPPHLTLWHSFMTSFRRLS